jgi:cytidyltransferase-like protein
LTLGKYAPLHRGHQLVIETALAEMDEVAVIVYDSPETTDIPLRVRSDWIRRLYPEIEVIEAWDGPTQVGYTYELMHTHEDYILSRLDVGKVTHFYS